MRKVLIILFCLFLNLPVVFAEFQPEPSGVWTEVYKDSSVVAWYNPYALKFERKNGFLYAHIEMLFHKTFPNESITRRYFYIDMDGKQAALERIIAYDNNGNVIEGWDVNPPKIFPIQSGTIIGEIYDMLKNAVDTVNNG